MFIKFEIVPNYRFWHHALDRVRFWTRNRSDDIIFSKLFTYAKFQRFTIDNHPAHIILITILILYYPQLLFDFISSRLFDSSSAAPPLQIETNPK